MEIALQLRLADHPVRETVAWLLTSSDHSFWLDEVCTQDSALSRIRLFPLPKSRTDITVGSVLVVSESSISMSRGIPFGCLCGQVYLPQCAEIVPPLKQDELRTLLLPDYEYVWHPGLGMIAFTEDEYILAADLLQVQKPKAMKTDLAQMGLAFPNRVHSMTAVVSIDDLADLFQQEQNEIGDKSSQIDELPNVPDEPTDQILENAKQRLDQAVARAAQWFTGLFPKVEGDEANWLGKLESWAQEKLVQARSRDDFLRHKEIERLVHLLDSDPDNGLRYALPFGGNLHRGVGDASNRLVPRKVDFSLRGTGGQGDVWDVGAKYEQILLKRYHRLATREIGLRRHRRAAYIYAELIGDLSLAASTLENGGHYREAAVLYRDRLSNPTAAANCLWRGGLVTEAIAIFETQQDYLKVGELYTEIDQPDQARIAYEKAIDIERARQNHISAANIYEERLQDTNGAIAELDRGWNSRQAISCFKRIVDLLREHGRHDEAGQRIAGLPEDPHLPSVFDLTKTTAELATQYPTAEVRAVASESTKRLVATRLRDAVGADAQKLTQALARLAPDDRLLARDGRQFSQQRPKLIERRGKRNRKRIQLIRTIKFQLGNAEWMTSAVSQQLIYAAGVYADHGVILSRCSIDSHVQHCPSPWKVPVRADQRMVMLANPTNCEQIGLYIVGGAALNLRHAFRPIDALPHATQCGNIASPSQASVAIGGSANQTIVLTQLNAGDRVLAFYENRRIVRSRNVSDLLDTPIHGATKPSIAGTNDYCYIGCDSQLHIIHDKGDDFYDFHYPVLGVTTTRAYTVRRVAVTFQRGAKLFWHVDDQRWSPLLAPDIVNPIAAFNHGGYLVVGGEQRLEVFDSKHRNAVSIGQAELTSPTIGVHPLKRSDQFAVVAQDGTVAIWEIG